MSPHMQLMGEIHIRRKVLKWGNGYGIRLTKAEMEQAELAPGQEADVVIHSERRKVDLSHLKTLHLGGLSNEQIDRMIEEGALRHHAEKNARS